MWLRPLTGSLDTATAWVDTARGWIVHVERLSIYKTGIPRVHVGEVLVTGVRSSRDLECLGQEQSAPFEECVPAESGNVIDGYTSSITLGSVARLARCGWHST